MAGLRPAAAAAEPPALLAARYELACRTVLIAGTSFSVTVVRDTNALLDRITPEAFARDERLPYWAELWTSSIELARWCLQGGVRPGMHVLEIGCGVGLVGMAAARAGARVVLTDYEPDALAFARLNCAANGATTAGFDLLDWRLPYRGPRYGLVLGADVTYERALFDPLLDRLTEILAPGASAVLAEPDREIGRGFRERAALRGFAVRSETTAVDRDGRTSPVVRSTLRREIR